MHDVQTRQGVRHAVVETVLGPLTLVADGDALTGVYYPGHWTRPDEASWGPAVPASADAVLQQAAEELVAYLAGERTAFDVRTAAPGEAFQQQVWRRLRAIPRGETVTYGAIARELGNVGLARMVGRAVGHNPLSIVVPCHRVVGTSGALTGYAGGLERKERLLRLEGWEPDQPALF